MSDDISKLKEEEKAADGSGGRNQNWVVGLVLIVMGGLFLYSNITDADLGNWWAMFILIPAVINFGHAWQSYQENGRLSRGARSSVIWGFFFVLLACAFYFNWSWDYIWPLFLIIGGLAILLNGWLD